ncbi:MAG: glycosyltransferase, partial [Rhodothermales bacterium]|nr:glycosyltransferase [Rhodothermales bacterium]
VTSLSVVVAATGMAEQLERCLDALARQTVRPEVIVVSNRSGNAPASSTDSPPVSFVSMDASTTVPRLRAEGIARASGDVVVLTEDNAVPDTGWCEEILRAHRAGHEVVGGPIDNEPTGRLADWAAYFYEYGRYMPPVPSGEADALPGNNVSYRRSDLLEIADHFEDGFYEVFVHDELKRLGRTLRLHSTALVHHIGRYEAGTVLSACYHHARAYAGMRTRNRSAAVRLLFATGTVILPVLLTARIGRIVLSRQRYVGPFFRSLVWLVPFTCSWALGELSGYLAGTGDSTRHWT